MPVTITLEDDEALVLFEALASETIQAVGPVERYALARVEGLLEKELVEPFRADYEQLVQAARASLAKRAGSDSSV